MHKLHFFVVTKKERHAIDPCTKNESNAKYWEKKYKTHGLLFPPLREKKWTDPFLPPQCQYNAHTWHTSLQESPEITSMHIYDKQQLYVMHVRGFTVRTTLDRDFWLASIVTSPAQHTMALELERPELAGIVPSTIQHIPANEDKLKCSCIHKVKGQMTVIIMQ